MIDFPAETPQTGAEAQLTEGMSVVPSNNGGRIHRLGFIEIIEDDTEKVEMDTEGMTAEELRRDIDLMTETRAEGIVLFRYQLGTFPDINDIYKR